MAGILSKTLSEVHPSSEQMVWVSVTLTGGYR